MVKKNQKNNIKNTFNEPIAIIGMSCSLPNAPDIAAFESLLEEGRSGIKDIPIERWDNRKYYDPNKDAPRKSYVNKMGLIENIKYFDAHFFGISPREAKLIDPQQRIFLECSYKALEHANYPPASLRGSLTGVFAGVGPNEYYATLEKSGFSNEELSAYSITGNVLNLIPGRVAYTFDFKGPSISIDTSCSSSLVAIHYACSSLKNREIDYALAGGVNILLMPESNITLCKARALSPDGQCKTFDEKADGYARGEGCGVIFLKRLSDALRDKDTILAVIKASAVNNDGKTAGLTVPNGKSQEEVMMKALSQTDLSNSDIGYIEAHGTGTSLGDPIEAHAINTVYGNQRSEDNPLYLGTVKTNIGHLEAASGVAGIIKTVISLQKKKIYRHLNFNKLNPKIKINGTRIALHNTDWNTRSKRKCAGVNAFGFSGTNAHIILQEFPIDTAPKLTKPAKKYVLVLSAKSKTALENLARRYQQYLATTQHDFSDICFTTATCRDHYTYRLALTAQSSTEASRLLDARQFVLSHGENNTLEIQNDTPLKLLLIAYLQGQQVDWTLYYKTTGYEFIKVTLPHYTFDRREFWSDKKSDNLPLISYETSLQNLYYTSWNKLKVNVPMKAELPDFLVISNEVISNDQSKAKKILGTLNYQLIPDLSTLVNIENKNIIFLFEQGQFINLVHCCQTLFKLRPNSFILVTENAFAINDNDTVNPYHTMASSFWKSFRNELNLNKNYTVDLDSNSTLISVSKYLFNTSSDENQFAVRDSIYIPRLMKKQLPINLNQQEMLFDSDASFLIIGGTGGLAKPLIEYLIRRGVKHIIITSRSVCPMDTKALIEIARQKQVDIRHYEADASNYQQMEHILDTIERGSKPLKGVFHLAGVVRDGLIVNLSDEDINSVLKSKVDSALILHQLTKNIPLDVFVLFSSSASLLGARGQSNYVAANGFLDGLAHLRKQQSLPAIVINWGPFCAMGMTANLTQALQQYGFIPLDKDSIDILDVLLKSKLTQIAPCPIHWDIYFKHSPKQIELSELIKSTVPTEQYFLNSLRQQTKDECITILSHALCEITADILGLDDIEQITAQDDLLSMGLDSLMSIEIRNRIHDKLQCPSLSLSIEYFINDPIINKIAKNIADELQNIFDNATDNHPSEHFTNEEIALCDFQYTFWAINKLDYSYNTAMQLQLHGKLNKDHLVQSFDFVVNQNKAFWMNFNKNTPTQKLNKQGQFKLIYEDISLNNEKNMLNQKFYNNTMRIIPLTEQPLIRVYLYKINNDLHELHMVFPHIIVDDTSCEIVFSQFKNSYGMLTLGKKLIQIPEKDSFLNYVKHNNLHYEKNIKDKIAFWQAYNKECTLLNFGPENHLPDAAAYQPKHLFHYPIAPQFMEHFVSWHKEKNINLSSGLIAACQIVFHKMSRQKKIPIILIHTGREGSQYKSIVGLFSEYKRINSTFNKEDKFIDCVKSIEEQLLKTAPYQKCSYFIKNKGLQGSQLSIGQYATFIYNKLFLKRDFKKSKLNSMIIDCYLEYLSRITSMRINSIVKQKFNKLFKRNVPLQKPDGLKVLINITGSIFIKEPENMNFADLNYTFPSYFGGLDRPIGNQNLWIYFSKNAHGEYQLSINGPLTTESKDQIALNFNKIIAKFTESDELDIG